MIELKQPWAVVSPAGLVHVELDCQSEERAWTVALGWPDAEEVQAHKDAGWYAVPCTVSWKGPQSQNSAAPGATPAPAAVPLTEAQIAKALATAGLLPEDYREDGMIEPLVRAIEKAHGIAAVPGKGDA